MRSGLSARGAGVSLLKLSAVLLFIIVAQPAAGADPSGTHTAATRSADAFSGSTATPSHTSSSARNTRGHSPDDDADVTLDTDADHTLDRHAWDTTADVDTLTSFGLSWPRLLAGVRHLPDDLAWMQLPTAQERVEQCADMAPLFSKVKSEVSTWSGGITRAMMTQAINMHTTRFKGRAGVALGFKGGQAYLPREPKLHSAVGFHATIILTYIKVMVLLEQLFGSEIPDIEFVISTVDRPLTPPSHLMGNVTPIPVMRFCKTPAFPDLLVPNFHSYMKEYTGGLSKLARTINTDKPWGQRDDLLFGRFTPYIRQTHPEDPYVHRVGVGGASICTSSPRTRACDVRTHFCTWAHKQTNTMDVSCIKRTPMALHADHKYLLHLDGQGLSSRFEQLMYLGSLILREESGYIGYFYHLLEPHKHFLPVWKQRPEEVLDALSWAKAHDQDARRMGEAAQQLALRYLGPKGKACYWLHLLREYASHLTYTPGPPTASDPTANCSDCTKYWRPVLEFARDKLVPWLVEHKSKNHTFAP